MRSREEGEGGWSFCDTSTYSLGHRSVTEGGGGSEKVQIYLKSFMNRALGIIKTP